MNPLPSIRTFQQLAQRVEVTPDELHWLCNRKSPLAGSASKHYRCRWMQKRSGGWRLIESSKPMLRQVQRHLLSQIFNLVQPHPLSSGFAKGRSVVQFAKPHQHKDACWLLDLKDFFCSVTCGRVYGLARTLGYNRSVAHAIALLTTTDTEERVLTFEHPNASFNIQDPTYLRRHLPQGAPTSPAIANLCAVGMDIRLSGLARKIGGVCYSRYADDILFSGDADLARQTKRLLPVVGAIVSEEGFKLNFRKARLMRSSQQQRAAGIVLNRKLNVNRQEFDRLKAILYNCLDCDPESQNRDQHRSFRQHLDGRIQWIEQLNPRRGKKLRALFRQIEWS